MANILIFGSLFPDISSFDRFQFSNFYSEIFLVAACFILFLAAFFERLASHARLIKLEDKGLEVNKFPLNFILSKRKLSKIVLRVISLIAVLTIGFLSKAILPALFFVVLIYLSSYQIARRTAFSNFSKSFLYILSWFLIIPFLCIYPFALFGLKREKLSESFLSSSSNPEKKQISSELATLVTGSEDKVVLHKEEEEMIQGVCEFAGTVVREVMSPRTDIIVVPLASKFSEVVKTVKDSGYSRFPVVKETLDDVEGILLAKDLIGLSLLSGKDLDKSFKVSDLMRETYFVPNNKPIDSLLAEFKIRKDHIAIVLDEHGGVDGLVTLEDLIEEIVGEIYDESDDSLKPEIKVQDSGEVMLDGGVLVDDLNERFSLEIPLGDYDTVAGYMLSKLGRMPKEGDEVRIDDGGSEGSRATKLESLNSKLEQSSEESSSDDETTSILKKLIVNKIDGHRIESIKLI